MSNNKSMSNNIDFIRRLEMGITVKYDNYGEVINDKITTGRTYS